LVNHKKKFGKTKNTWRLNNMLLKNEWVNQEIKEEIKKYMETNENENMMVQNLWVAAKVLIRGNYVAIQKTQEARKISNKQPNLTSKGARKRKNEA